MLSINFPLIAFLLSLFVNQVQVNLLISLGNSLILTELNFLFNILSSLCWAHLANAFLVVGLIQELIWGYRVLLHISFSLQHPYLARMKFLKIQRQAWSLYYAKSHFAHWDLWMSSYHHLKYQHRRDLIDFLQLSWY